MSHNKMYREIEGYEESLYSCGDIIDETEDLREMIRYGENRALVLDKLNELESKLKKMKKELS